jgi:hypothetical protein
MSLDMDKTLDDMVAAAAGALSKDASKVEACVRRAYTESREALENIARKRLAGDFDDAGVESELEDEAETLKAALLACTVRTKAAAQKAINAAFEVLKKAIKAALG